MKTSFLPILANTLPTWALVLIIVGSVIIVLNIVSAISAHLYRSKKAKNVDGSAWLTALGGKENIKSAMGIGSRLNVVLNDYEAIDREQLGKMGVISTFSMSTKIILVMDIKTEFIAKTINESIKE